MESGSGESVASRCALAPKGLETRRWREQVLRLQALLGCGPARKELDALFAGRAGVRAVGDHGEADVCGELHRLVRQVQVADDRVPDLRAAGSMLGDVVVGPERAEDVAAVG